MTAHNPKQTYKGFRTLYVGIVHTDKAFELVLIEDRKCYLRVDILHDQKLILGRHEILYILHVIYDYTVAALKCFQPVRHVGGIHGLKIVNPWLHIVTAPLI